MSIDLPHVPVTAEVAPAAQATANPATRGGRRNAPVDLIVKRAARRGYDGDDGGSWKVAFADFCLALMCLFLLLWALSARDEEARLNAMVDNVLYDDDSDEVNGVPPVLNAAVLPDSVMLSATDKGGDDAKHAPSIVDTREALHALAERVRTLGEEAGLLENLQAIVTPMGLRIMLHDTDERGVFVSGGAVPSEPFRPMLTKLGALMGTVGNSLVVIGHTDSVPYRPLGFGSRSNWDLSVDRAMSARRSLLEGGMASGQVLEVVGMADQAPLANDPRAAINRRIEFLVLTPERARALQAMFGPPEHVVPLTEGVNATSAGEPDASRVGSQFDVVLDKKKT
ncbi:OmpA family protein [Burkholderia dolosa]|uniref:flagellar motor protein MotB n=1 Tax=Burkholderia dolosa TaxID=152500 RepID=UPI0015909C54|nr:flagellar motor protein MotB [Burkholderia dolosa]MBR8460495.1 OmpA family protein [Burkholderia dolosa]